MPVYGPGSKYLGRTENETEWRRFDVPQAPGNSHCAPTFSDVTIATPVPVEALGGREFFA